MYLFLCQNDLAYYRQNMDPQFVVVYLQLRLVMALVYMFGLLMRLSELQRVPVEGKGVVVLIIVVGGGEGGAEDPST
jgi:hypothetical protein